MTNDISSLTISFNCVYQHVCIFNEFNDKFDKLDNDCWIGIFNIECIVRLSILNIALPMDATSKTLVLLNLKICRYHIITNIIFEL
jgi:hypothetical protein